MGKTTRQKGIENKYVLINLNNAENGQQEEFYTFCPILRDMISIISAKCLVIINVFRFLTEYVISLKNNKNYFKNCIEPLQTAISASHREMQNFGMSVLHGNRALSGSFFSNPYSEISEILKSSAAAASSSGTSQSKSKLKFESFSFNYCHDEAIDTEIKSIISNSCSSNATLNALNNTEKPKMIAKKIIENLNADPFTMQRNQGHNSIIQPSVQYITILYEPFKLFSETCEFLSITK
jgi:hypothetical protein